MTKRLGLRCLGAVLLWGCGGCQESWKPKIGPAIPVVPSNGLPAELPVQTSNNNLDVVRHKGFYYLAFRSAPAHFASEEACLHMVRSKDQKNWEKEESWCHGTDLREPRLLSWGDRLFMYFAVLGSDPTKFEPQGMMVTERGPDGWTKPVSRYQKGFVPWRVKVINDRPYLVGYSGGASIYEGNEGALSIHWLTTDDGYTWRGVDPDKPVVMKGGGSEADFVIREDGSLVSVVRNDAGDEDGFGSKICVANAGALADWSCLPDKRRFDSPLLFQEDGRVFLVARRNLSATGFFDSGISPDLPAAERYFALHFAYWKERKRCSVWEVSPSSRSVDWKIDLPSKGDTCFPSIVRDEEGVAWIYNYSSPLLEDDPSWFLGQLGETYVYRLAMR